MLQLDRTEFFMDMGPPKKEINLMSHSRYYSYYLDLPCFNRSIPVFVFRRGNSVTHIDPQSRHR